MRAAKLWSVAVAMVSVSGCGGGGPVPVLPDKIVGHCTYVNGFSKREECRDYVGEWTDQQATDDCKGQGKTVVLGSACGIEQRLGYCILTNDKEKQQYTRITFPGEDADRCSSSKRGCEFFGGGVFDPAPVCGGVLPDTGGTGLPTFQPPSLSCVDPKPGESAGLSEGGKVCTWNMISAATEPGRHFDEYASCDQVRTQRPYYAVPPAEGAAQPDARLDDPTYAAEVTWVKQQIESTACICCHSTRAPEGSSNWFVESGPNFVNSFFPRGLAMGAGWIDTVGFGAFPPEKNNGFTRATPQDPTHTIFVTTDNARMKRFFEGELAHRGIARETFPAVSYGAGPLDDQRFYRPTACQSGEGMDADGTLRWLNGRARYVYVLDANAESPTVPPNLDLPAGTRWRLDVPVDGQAVASGSVKYGQVPAGLNQRLPESGAPAALISGNTYYLYVLADVAQPNTRCLFTAP